MDTLVFLCQHTCTMVLPRCREGLSSETRDAVTSSSDSASTKESSGHSGKVRRSLLLDNEWGDEGRRALKHRQCQIIHKLNALLCIWDFSRRIFYSKSIFWQFVCVPVHLLTFIWLCSNLLLSIRLQVKRSAEGPLLLFIVSIAPWMSSIHFSISISELEGETHMDDMLSRSCS